MITIQELEKVNNFLACVIEDPEEYLADSELMDIIGNLNKVMNYETLQGMR